MLEKNNHIDELFSNYLGDFEEKAPDYLWHNIQSELNNHRRVKRSTRLQAVAAGIALLLTFGLGYLSSDIAKKNKFQTKHIDINYVNTDKQQFVVVDKYRDSFKEYSLKLNKTDVENVNDNQAIASEKKSVENQSLLYRMFDVSKNKFLPITVQKEKPGSSLALSNKNTGKKTSNQLLIDTLLLEEGNLSEGGFLLSKKKDKPSRWSFGTKFSPVYSVAESSDQLAAMENQGLKASINNDKPNTQAIEKAALAFSGGLNVNYQFAHRWSVESGVFYSQSRRIADNLVGSSMNGINDGLAIYTPEGVKQVQSDFKSQSFRNNQIIGTSRNETYYSLKMNYVSNFNYIELPVIVRYKIIDRKIGFDILSGISTNFLIGNRSSIVQDDVSLWTGQTQATSPLLYNATLGFGVNYNFYKSLSFNLEPTFKYSLINSESNSVIKYPYSFAVFAGFSYRFK